MMPFRPSQAMKATIMDINISTFLKRKIFNHENTFKQN